MSDKKYILKMDFHKFLTGIYADLWKHLMKPNYARATAFVLISKERDRQDNKWGEQNHPPQFWTGILGEEYGEYCQAVNETVFDNGPEERKKGGRENMIKELTHVAAVAVGAIESLMRERIKEEGEIHETI